MRTPALRITLIALAAIALLISGCAKKSPAPMAAPPAPAPVAPSTPPVPTPSTDTNTTPSAATTSTTTVADLKIVYFAVDSWVLDDPAHAVLDGNAKLLRDSAGLKARIEGHCDERGTVEYNISLGQKRAEAVRDYLVAAGVPADRLTTLSYGKERPASDGHDEAAWSRNRRAEFSKP